MYFCICVDIGENELYYLEAIHNFVEVLNEYFHNVCELDLVFNFYKVCNDQILKHKRIKESSILNTMLLQFQVYTVVEEMFLAGEVRETSQAKVLKQLLVLTSLE